MNEELEQLIQEIKSTLPWLLAAGILVAGYYGVRNYVANKRAAASEAVANAYTTEELEEAVAKFGSSKSGGLLKLRLAKSYFDAGDFNGALEIYEELGGKAPDGFEDVSVVGKAQCLEGLAKFNEAQKVYDDFASANAKSFLLLTAKLGSARCVARAGDKKKAIAALEEVKKSLGDDDEIAKSRVDATIDIVKRYEQRKEVSLFAAADAAQKQIEQEAGNKAAAAKSAEKVKDEKAK